MRMWMKIGIGVAAVLLAVVVGTGAYAMLSDDDDGQETTRELDDDANGNPQTASDDENGGGALGICIEGTVDCVDTPLNPEDAGGGAAGGTCLEGSGDCVDTPMRYADCKPDATECLSDVALGFTCEPGLTIEQCMPDGVPADHECMTMESDPIQVKCTPICLTNPPAAEGDADDPNADGSCTPTEDCSQPADNARCLPPECAVSSDGSVACPGEDACAPDNCPSTEPGVACPEGVTDEECARGSSGSGGGTDAAPPEVDPAPALEQ